MQTITLSQIVKATRGSLISGSRHIKISGVSTDTRTISFGDLFIALRGEKFDGHLFLEEAFKKGAAGAIVSKDRGQGSGVRGQGAKNRGQGSGVREQGSGDKRQRTENRNRVIIKVEDTLRALGDIAKIYRDRFDVPVVAISGSSGKTTTKEMLSHILSEEFNVVKARASFNNFVGVPLTLLEIKEDAQVVILEMETNLLGGITRLCEIAHPEVGIVTNIGDTHLESLETKEGVYKEKSELIESLPGEGVAILNSDDPYVVRMKKLAKTKKVISFGIESKADFSASHLEIKDGFVEFTLNPAGCGRPRGAMVRLNTIFPKNAYNALAAMAVSCSVFGLDLEKVIAKLREFKFPSGRMEIINFKDVRIINDSYNANPQSMKEALLALKNLNPGGDGWPQATVKRRCPLVANGANTPGRRIAVLGDMLELGEKAPDFHYQVGRLCPACQIDILITIGDLARHIARGAKDAGMVKKNIFALDDILKTAEMLSHILKPKDVVLIKGSRRMKMEEIVNALSRAGKTGEDVLWQK